ncbi:unnamed protein product [Ceratitis capitata]|uniref:(Mediterranean fruit fly) hypothetical protein n=1 Tax=Ceratitis capitata TaxID=7213 RepID=A0A811UCL8_CERCA|nr:unnamed protein product [Ceratitis capitata]
MFGNCDTNGQCADGQRLACMDQFTLPMYDPWQPSIDFMLWPPGSCDYGAHVGMCPNMQTQSDCCEEPKHIPRSPWPGLAVRHNGTINNLSYCRPYASLNGCVRSNVTSPENPLFNPSVEFRRKDLPSQTPIWKPNGPMQRFSEKL